MLPAGKLNKRITITAPGTASKNAYGENASATPTTIARVWAEILAVGVREINVAKAFGATVNTKITIRYRADLKKTYRVVYGSRSFNINGWVDPDGLKENTIIYATEAL